MVDAAAHVAERLLTAAIEMTDLTAVAVGDRLGYYRLLNERGPLCSPELAAVHPGVYVGLRPRGEKASPLARPTPRERGSGLYTGALGLPGAARVLTPTRVGYLATSVGPPTGSRSRLTTFSTRLEPCRGRTCDDLGQ